MERIVNFEVDELEKIDLDDYSDDEFAIARMGFLSTRPNSHELKISEEVLIECAQSVLNKWVVADMQCGEPTTHTKNEHIVGRIPKEQSVEFVYDDEGYLRAYVDTVISKIYAKDFCAAFEQDKTRSVSVEMKIFTDNQDENIVQRFNIVGVTVLGKMVKPSCPESDIEFVRFSEEKADKFFKEQIGSFTQLQKFVEMRKQAMAEKKTYKIDKSKEAMIEADWSDVDKSTLRDKIMGAANRAALVKATYMLIEEGWEDAPSEKLKYPVMAFDGDILVYYHRALSSALAYAKQNNEETVVNKIEKIYKKLDLDTEESGKKEKMAEMEFSAVNIGDLWGRVYSAIHEHDAWDYCIQGIYEEDNQKFAVLIDREQKLYRLDFSLTEDGMTVADELTEVKQEFTETDNIKKFAEPENIEQYTKFADTKAEEDVKSEENEVEMSVDELKAKLKALEKDIEDRDHIIMDKDVELAELRSFKEGVEAKEKAMCVEATMAEIKPFVNEEKFAEFREEGLACNKAGLDAWTNKVKALCFSEVKKNIKKDDKGVFSFAAPIEIHKKSAPTNVWDRIKENY